jgi:hypothetical protein
MTIERIYTRAQPGGPTVPRLRARLAKGQGIEGDRYFGIVEEPSVNVTLIEAEAIEALLGELGLAVDFSITGRNLVTRGVQLNRWVGRDFMAGPVRLRGVELAEPCLTLGSAIAERLALRAPCRAARPGAGRRRDPGRRRPAGIPVNARPAATRYPFPSTGGTPS